MKLTKQGYDVIAEINNEEVISYNLSGDYQGEFLLVTLTKKT